LTESAIERALPLLRAKERRRADTSDGFIDVLGSDLPSTGRVQDLMRVRAVSPVYERWGGPARARRVKGGVL
jgi:hypothetical protein